EPGRRRRMLALETGLGPQRGAYEQGRLEIRPRVARERGGHILAGLPAALGRLALEVALDAAQQRLTTDLRLARGPAVVGVAQATVDQGRREGRGVVGGDVQQALARREQLVEARVDERPEPGRAQPDGPRVARGGRVRDQHLLGLIAATEAEGQL